MTSTTIPSEEEARTHCGLSRTQWDQLTQPEDDPESFLPEELLAEYNGLIQTITEKLDVEFRRPAFVLDNVPFLSTVQTADALGVGEFHLSTMRSRGKLKGQKYGRRTIYSREILDRFLTSPDEAAERKSALALAFVRLMEKKRP